MPIDLHLIKTHSGWANGDAVTEDFHHKVKLGQSIHGPYTRMRNAGFHRKLMALLQLAFEYWEPGEVDSKHGVPEKNFNRFRHDVTILAGYYHNVIRIDGSVRVEADSISFANMDQDTFEKLYQAALTVLMNRIPMMAQMGTEVDKFGNTEIDKITNQLLEFV